MAAPIKCMGRLLFSLKCIENAVVRKHVPFYQSASRCLSSSGKSALSDASQLTVATDSDEQTVQISNAMKAYLERASGHEKFMQEEIADYEIGKRHLANMMGADPEDFTQGDVDRAIEYLLPSALFDKKARPILKHPDDVIPKRKAAQFGMDGRPFDFLFYTMRPNYYGVLHECALKIEALKKHADEMFKKYVPIPEDGAQIMLVGGKWITKLVLEGKLQERVKDNDYTRFIRMLERLAAMPYSLREEDFVMQYRTKFRSKMLQDDVAPLTVDEGAGRAYVDMIAKRKSCKAQVRVWSKGNGKVTVNEKPFVEFFPEIIDREQVMFPLQFTGNLMELDLEATVEGGGHSGQAGAIRLATSRALQSFVTPQVREQMRLAGLLSTDPRMRERKKPGQEKARKKFTWKKR